MNPERQLVLDANILIRAVLGRRVRQIINDHATTAGFFTPEVAYDDAVHYVPEVLEKHDKADTIKESLEYLEVLRRTVRPIPEEAYAAQEERARVRIEARDVDDWPILALALALDCPIWTEDQDFFGIGVPTWTTDRVEIFLNEGL